MKNIVDDPSFVKVRLTKDNQLYSVVSRLIILAFGSGVCRIVRFLVIDLTLHINLPSRNRNAVVIIQVFSTDNVFWNYQDAAKKKPVVDFDFSNVVGEGPATLLKPQNYHRYFPGNLFLSKHLFWVTPLEGCLCKYNEIFDTFFRLFLQCLKQCFKISRTCKNVWSQLFFRLKCFMRAECSIQESSHHR